MYGNTFVSKMINCPLLNEAVILFVISMYDDKEWQPQLYYMKIMIKKEIWTLQDYYHRKLAKVLSQFFYQLIIVYQLIVHNNCLFNPFMHRAVGNDRLNICLQMLLLKNY